MRGRSEPLTLAEVARDEGLTVAYVAKIVRRLRRAGLVKSVLGRSGGYTLSRDPGQITVAEVLSALGDRLYDTGYCNRFAGDRKVCTHFGACTIQSLWGVVERLLDRVLGHTTLQDLLAGVPRPPMAIEVGPASAGERR
jgi:Rrf2 family protein